MEEVSANRNINIHQCDMVKTNSTNFVKNWHYYEWMLCFYRYHRYSMSVAGAHVSKLNMCQMSYMQLLPMLSFKPEISFIKMGEKHKVLHAAWSNMKIGWAGNNVNVSCYWKTIFTPLHPNVLHSHLHVPGNWQQKHINDKYNTFMFITKSTECTKN